MPTALNPSLYGKLKLKFGAVKISNEGESFMARSVLDLNEEPVLVISHPGEYYRVSCPFCSDTTQRLYVNHMFGKRDGHGRRMNFLAICYNEGCLSRGDNLRVFIERLNGLQYLEDAEIEKGVEVGEEARAVLLPGPCTPLHRLAATHKAKRYLVARGFDPDLLSRKFGVSYCTESPYFLAKDRIIIPIEENGKLKGWQARHVGELPWKDPARKKDLPPKYFSCPHSQFRSRVLYGWDLMKKWATGVVVEGPTDKWRFGDMAGCVFGNSVTEHQRRRLLAVFKKRALVLLLDPEEFDSHSTRRGIAEFERGMSARSFCAVKLPDDTDPGSLGRQWLHDYVRAEARAQGVRVSYKRL